MDIWLFLLVVTVGATDSPEAMAFIKALCPPVAFERPKVKGLRAFGFRLFYECGTKPLIGPIGVDVQLFNPIPIQNQHTANHFVDFSHPHLGTRHDGSHEVPLHLLVRMHKGRNRRYRRMARAQENFCGSPMVRFFGPPNHGHAVNSHSRRSTTCVGHAQPVVSEGDLNAPDHVLWCHLPIVPGRYDIKTDWAKPVQATEGYYPVVPASYRVQDIFDRVASRYDESLPGMFLPDVLDPTVDFLAELAGNGPVLELGIGTGRVALPLVEKGISVHGIDLSQAMVERLRTKPGGGDVEVTIGDFATTQVEGDFSLAYLVFSTITNLTTEDAQVECFANVAKHLGPGGRFVIENVIPALHRLQPGEKVVPIQVTPTRLHFEEYDVVNQTMVSHHYRVVEGHLEVLSTPHRYVWPSELDLMARHAGMTLRERWATWTREPFTSTSPSHISVWEKTT